MMIVLDEKGKMRRFSQSCLACCHLSVCLIDLDIVVQRRQDWCAVVWGFPRLGTALCRTGPHVGLLAKGAACH